tara:strand:+ start:468 stop:977 length:510 start_codon:yes stop_codon:yes gene_type:complete
MSDIITYAFGLSPAAGKETNKGYISEKDLKDPDGNIGIRIGRRKNKVKGMGLEPTEEIGVDITEDYKGAYIKKKFSKGGMPTRRKSAGNYRSTKSGAGMTQKGVMAYRRKNPGSKLQTAVTGKVKPGSKAAKRRKSYCARSLGQLKRASAKTRNDPNSRIRQARRRWKC